MPLHMFPMQLGGLGLPPHAQPHAQVVVPGMVVHGAMLPPPMHQLVHMGPPPPPQPDLSGIDHRLLQV